MSLIIDTVRAATDEEWDEIWSGCEYATYFHSREWAETWAKYTRGKISPSPRLLIFSDGKRALYPLAVNKRYRGVAREYLSSPGGAFGGWIGTDGLNRSHGELLDLFLLENCPSFVLRHNPYNPVVESFKKLECQDDETHVLDLSPGFDTVFKGWSKGHSSAAKKARREGVVVRVADSMQDWHEYFAVYQDSLRRWGDAGTSSYTFDFFEELQNQGAGSVRLWLGEFSGRVVAGALCLYARQHVVYWHGAALEEFFNVRPVHYVLYEAIRDACEAGYRWFDYNPSGGHEGVKSFKRNFGAEAQSCPVFSRKSGLVRILNVVSAK